MLASLSVPLKRQFSSDCECFRKNVAVGGCNVRRRLVIEVRRSQGDGNKDDKPK